MKKGTLLLCVILGVCLIVGSLSLVLVSRIQMRKGSQESREILSQINDLLPERTQGEPYPATQMPVLDINGTDYVAILEVPAFQIVLPVTDDWSDKNLYCTPSRFWGSAYEHSLVVGGGDYPQQFDFCDKVELGTLVTVTDMTGAQFTYSVSRVDRAEHAASQWLISPDFDLTLFCHDTLSMEYIAVRCTSHPIHP